MSKIIALFGKSGSGKDTIKKKLMKIYPNLHELVPWTTRPMRGGEREGEPYHFVGDADFHDAVWRGDIPDPTYFRNWGYGFNIADYFKHNLNIGVFNPAQLNRLQFHICYNHLDVQLFPIYIECTNTSLIQRSLAREKNTDCEEVCRRYLADLKDFNNNNLFYTYWTLFNDTTSYHKNDIENFNQWTSKPELDAFIGHN